MRKSIISVVTIMALAVPSASFGNSIAHATASPKAGQFCSHGRNYQPYGLKCMYRNGHYRLYHN
jgi:hypothetical protein